MRQQIITISDELRITIEVTESSHVKVTLEQRSESGNLNYASLPWRSIGKSLFAKTPGPIGRLLGSSLKSRISKCISKCKKRAVRQQEAKRVLSEVVPHEGRDAVIADLASIVKRNFIRRLTADITFQPAQEHIDVLKRNAHVVANHLAAAMTETIRSGGIQLPREARMVERLVDDLMDIDPSGFIEPTGYPTEFNVLTITDIRDRLTPVQPEKTAEPSDPKPSPPTKTKDRIGELILHDHGEEDDNDSPTPEDIDKN